MNTMATFAYLRVSTTDQTTENQKLEIQKSGFQVDYWFSENVSGAMQASQRPEFMKLLGQIRDGETLVVTKLDRLGRNAIDVQQTVELLRKRNIRVQVVQLGSLDLTSSVGKLALSMLSAVAEMERDLIVERTQAGLARAKAEGKILGRKSKTTQAQKSQIRELVRSQTTSISEIARRFEISRASVLAICRP
jgi:putative DNA-invertase from lambdoid prophage Rac